MTNEAARTKVLQARAVLLVRQKFWGHLAYNLPLVQDETIPTACTNGRELRYSPAYVLKLTDAQVRGLLVEEVSHIAHLHHTRRQNREPRAWNTAADLALSARMKNGGFDIADMLYDPQYANMSAEEIYAKRRQQKKDDSGAPGRGMVSDAPGGEAGRAMAEIQAQANLRTAVSLAKRAGQAGSIPGEFLELIEDFDAGRVDWKRRLRAFAEDSTVRETCWKVPSKRSPYPILLPGRSNAAPAKVGVAIDGSGSMGKNELRVVGGELQQMLDEGVAGEIVVAYHDTIVHKHERYSPGDMLTLEVPGRGGTAFGPALEWFKENEPDCASLIFLTDGDGNDNATIEDPGIPVLWGIIGGSRHFLAPSFGEPLDIDASEE